MIIKNITINSFGKLKEKSIDLSENLNIIYGTNESGKSTISSFIEAMLYAYPPRDASRKKYIPWSETVSSGNMTLDIEGNLVTVYRKLTASSNKNELFPPDFSLPENFPQDRETFRKCVYCKEDNVSDFGRTNEIDMRIANIITTGDENLNISRAIEKLENFKKSLTKKGGALKETENKITLLENELDFSIKYEEDHNEKAKKLTLLEEKISLLSKKREELLSSNKETPIAPLDEEIRIQKEYLSHFPVIPSFPDQFKFPTWTALFYTLCAIFIIIIGFFTNPFFSPLALLPLSIFAFHFFLSKSKHNKKCKNFLNSVNCTSMEEYEQMLSDKNNAENYYASLLAQKNDLVNKDINEKIRQNRLFNNITEEIVTLSDSIVAIKKSFSSAPVREKSVILSELNELKSKKEEINQKILSSEKAIEALTFAKNNLSKHLIPQIGKKAMEYINLIAPKEGRNITLEKDLSLFLTDPLPQDISSCSFGLKAEIYLCFRIALSEILYGKSTPLIFDDPFLGSDDYREKALIDLFDFLAKTRQIIVFTNRKNPYYNQIKCNFVDISPTNVV